MGSGESLSTRRDDVPTHGLAARELDRKTRTFIRENPTTTVAIGVAAGFLLGRRLSR